MPPKKLVQICNVLNSFREITWTRATVTICMIPFVLFLVILVLLFLLSTEHPGAVVSNTLVCASVGKGILEEGGSAVDAAIATMLCEGVALPNSAGIGGGFAAVLFAKGNFDSIIATPTAPLALRNITKFDASYAEGAKSAGVPGELMGYWEMHKKYGVLSWKQLFEPTIQLCEQGVPITEWLAGHFRYSTMDSIVQSKTMGTIFDFFGNEMLTVGHKIQFKTMAKTLRRIANEGVSAFYHGDIGDSFISDLQAEGGIMSKSDLENYKVVWDSHPPSLRMRGHFKVVTTPLPTSGAITVFILNVIKNLEYEDTEPLFWHKAIEAMKHAFGRSYMLSDAVNDPMHRDRIMKAYKDLIDPEFARKIRYMIKNDRVFHDPAYYGSRSVPKHIGSSTNICVTSPRGEVVALTSSILEDFGAFFASKSSGIIASNLLKPFTQQTLKKKHRTHLTNQLLPGKRTFCPYSPAIVIRSHTAWPYFIVGASGGPRATIAVALAVFKYVVNVTSASEAINTKFLYNQLYPNQVEYEDSFDENILSFLKQVGHVVVARDVTYQNFTAATCIGQRLRMPDIKFDQRIGGSAEIAHPIRDSKIVLIAIFGTMTFSIVGLLIVDVTRSPVLL